MHATLPNAVVERTDGGEQITGDGRRTDSAATVLRAVLDHGPVARSTVARLTGISPAAVGRNLAELARLGLVRDLPARPRQAAIGRPHIPVGIDTGRHTVCGVHIAVPLSTLSVMDLRGTVLAREVVPHRGDSAAEILGHVADRMADFLDEHVGCRPLGLGVATGGWVDPVAGVIVEHGRLGWRDVPVGRLLGSRSGLPVRVEGHSRALARAEQLFGSSRSRARSSLVHLFVGNVVDAAISTGGSVHHGPRSAGGDVAHFPLDDRSVHCSCGRAGCFEATVSDRTMGRLASEAGIVGEPSFDRLLAAAVDGDRRAVELFGWRARMVGRAAASLLDLINPELLVVSESGLAMLPDAAPWLLAELHAEVAARSHTCRDPQRSVVASSFAPDILAVAAGSIVLDEVYTRPLELQAVPT